MDSNYESHKKKLKYYPTQEGKMAYLDEGEGPCILLIHGVPTSSWLYRKIIPILVEKGHRVISPDMLGYGSSDKPDGYEIYSDAEMGQRILDLMNYIKIESWVQVFHDGGGLWTWAMLQIDSSRVTHLFMLNTIVYQEGFKPPIKFQKGFIAKFFTRLYSFSGLSQKMAINPTFSNGMKHKEHINKTMLEGYRKPLLGNGHHGIYYFFTQTCKKIKDYSELHKSIVVPITVIWGKWDDMLDWKGNEAKVKLNFGISDEDIYLIDAKHFIQEEQPQLITKIIVDNLYKSKKKISN